MEGPLQATSGCSDSGTFWMPSVDVLVALAALVLIFLVKQPTLEQMTRAEEGAAAAAARRAKKRTTKRGQPAAT